jgi:hypothetical protein
MGESWFGSWIGWPVSRTSSSLIQSKRLEPGRVRFRVCGIRVQQIPKKPRSVITWEEKGDEHLPVTVVIIEVAMILE